MSSLFADPPAGPASAAGQQRYPSLIEINTMPWLLRLSAAAGRTVTLADVDDAVLDELVARGIDWVWLLSVWRRSAAARAEARANPAWRPEFEAALPDLSQDDIVGSGFAVAAYEVDEALGGDAGLAAFRERLARRGIRLMLDFVPNHTAPDHAWVRSRPDFYVEGDEERFAASPESYVRVETERGGRILARGRDPNFPSWPDTLQLDYANPALQAAQTEVLLAIAARCDGLRCDMAMLLLPDVFQRTWGRTSEPFWPAAIAAVRAAHPGFTFLAEAYWDLEWELMQQGFDYCYDKRLYDRLRSDEAGPIRAHLSAGPDFQSRLARFLENHDEPRAAAVFDWPQHQAAAVVSFLAPGLRLFHDGEFDGARVRVPVHLRRGPQEPADPEVAGFYGRLLAALQACAVAPDSGWSLVAPDPAWPGNPTSENFIAFAWRGADGGAYLAVVNYSPWQGQCRLRLPFVGPADAGVRLVDLLGSETFERAGDELRDPGLYIDLPAWRYNLFRLDPR